MKRYDLSPAVAARVEKAFQQHPLTQDQQQRIEVIGEKLGQVTRLLATLTPECDEQVRMINSLKDAQYLATEAIRKNEA